MSGSRFYDLLVAALIVLGVGAAVTSTVLYGCDAKPQPSDGSDTSLVLADTVKQYERDTIPDNGHDRPVPHSDVVVNPNDTTYTVVMTDSTRKVSYIAPILYEFTPYIEIEQASRIRVILEKSKVAYIIRNMTMQRVYP